MSRKTNAVWTDKHGNQMPVYGDGGSMWMSNPSLEPLPAGGLMDLLRETSEVATYEPTEWDGDAETAWQVLVDGKINGTLRFEP